MSRSESEAACLGLSGSAAERAKMRPLEKAIWRGMLNNSKSNTERLEAQAMLDSLEEHPERPNEHRVSADDGK